MTPIDAPSRTPLPMTGAPLYERLAEHYRRIIAAGTLSPGDRMPSVRAFMAQHAVSLSPAIPTFRRLEDTGWCEAKPRPGDFVRRRAAAALGTVPETDAPPLSVAPPFAGRHERVSGVIDRGNAASDALNLGGASASATLYPAEPLQALAIRLLRRKPTLLTDAGPVGGSPEFRQTVARRALSYGGTVAPDDVMSTSGGVDAVNLALRAVAQPGDTIAIESPAFFGLIQMRESLGLRALEIPASPTTGLSIEARDVALTAYPDIRAVVVVPNLQNPLGSVMPDERKAALVALCSRHGVAVIEDEPYRELVEAPHAVKPVKAWDRDGTVIYCPSFNKVLAPGMRLGWISAGRWHARVKMLKFAHSRHNAALLQAVAAEFVGSGAFDRHLHRFREQLRVQRDVTIDAIARHFPSGTRMNRPPGGMLLWIALPDGVHSEALFDVALAQGIRIAPGSIFSNSDRFDAYIRLACTRVFDAAHEEAIQTLGRLIRDAAAAA
ncbi:aminotransferase-like domain-containing protein [Burkholderia vietnamiensis]|uniref:aminotransferase-like domain-containing protein n=1 Tax=Burkholderia vietnamiensis TaxID=60552 RepID=UPI000D78C966|nr:PLP-dependent aminotransferase family protein [Burkholderia vietnamiensis]